MTQPQICSGHDSHRPFRLERRAMLVKVNFGQTERHGNYVLNHSDGVMRIRDKKAMKILFDQAGVLHPAWSDTEVPDVECVLKSNTHRKGTMCKVTKKMKIDFEKYYVEEFIPFEREFRVHVSFLRPIFSTEKILRRNHSTWIRNLDSCTFKVEFEKPEGWDNMIKDCQWILHTADLDFAGFDIGYADGRFYFIEANTACGMGDKTRAAYTEELNRLTMLKQSTYCYTKTKKENEILLSALRVGNL